MPLRIKLPTRERVIINGAVIENGGEATTIILHNHVDLLRRKEVLTPDDANTPARRVYYALQCAYIFKDERPRHMAAAQEYLNQFLEASPSAGAISDKICAAMAEEALYRALRETLALIEHEAVLLNVYDSGMGAEPDGDEGHADGNGAGGKDGD